MCMSAAQKVFSARVRPKRTRFAPPRGAKGIYNYLRVRVLSFFSLHDSLPGYAHLWEENKLHWSLSTSGCEVLPGCLSSSLWAALRHAKLVIDTCTLSEKFLQDRAAPTGKVHETPAAVCCEKQKHKPASSDAAVDAAVDDAQHVPLDDRRRSSPRLTKRRRHGHARRQ